MRLIEDTRARSAYLLLLLAVLLAGDAWRYAFGWWAWAVLASVLVVASVGVLIVHRDRWAFGSLPYPLLVQGEDHPRARRGAPGLSHSFLYLSGIIPALGGEHKEERLMCRPSQGSSPR